MSGRENGYGCRRASDLFPSPERRQSVCLGLCSDRFGADNSRGSVPSHRNWTIPGGLEGNTGELRNYSGRPQKTCLGSQEAGRGPEETRSGGERARGIEGLCQRCRCRTHGTASTFAATTGAEGITTGAEGECQSNHRGRSSGHSKPYASNRFREDFSSL